MNVDIPTWMPSHQENLTCCGVVALVFFGLQGMGNFVNCCVILICMVMFGQTGTLTPQGSRDVMIVQFAVGAAVTVFLTLYRWLRLKESKVCARAGCGARMRWSPGEMAASYLLAASNAIALLRCSEAQHPSPGAVSPQVWKAERTDAEHVAEEVAHNVDKSYLYS